MQYSASHSAEDTLFCMSMLLNLSTFLLASSNASNVWRLQGNLVARTKQLVWKEVINLPASQCLQNHKEAHQPELANDLSYDFLLHGGRVGHGNSSEGLAKGCPSLVCPNKPLVNSSVMHIA